MSTWICRRHIAASLILLALSACTPGWAGGGLFSAAQPEDAAPQEDARANVALISADMARGEIKLTPPDGFCIDKTALEQSFALLARCDSLGGKGGAQDAPLGFITVSIADLDTPPQDMVATLLALAPDGSAVLDTQAQDRFALLHLSGDTPAGTDAQHWRGLMMIGSRAMALAAYGPEAGRMARSDGGALLASLAERTHDASVAAVVASGPGTKQRGTGLGGVLSGLFD